jgi:hypothetical protein
VFRYNSLEYAGLPGECWIPVPLPPPAPASRTFSAYDVMKTEATLNQHSRFRGSVAEGRRSYAFCAMARLSNAFAFMAAVAVVALLISLWGWL